MIVVVYVLAKIFGKNITRPSANKQPYANGVVDEVGFATMTDIYVSFTGLYMHIFKFDPYAKLGTNHISPDCNKTPPI